MTSYTDIKPATELQAKIFLICGCNVYKMFWLWVCVYFLVLMFQVSVEVIVWGEAFPNYFDIVITSFFLLSFLYFTNALGEFLLKLALSKGGKIEKTSSS